MPTKTEALKISAAEWQIMRVVWTFGNPDSNQVISAVQEDHQWAPSTVRTLLKRLTKKQLLRTEKRGRAFSYRPVVSEPDAILEKSLHLLQSTCTVKVGEILATELATLPLDQTDIAQLMAILKQRQLTAPNQLDCDCPPDDCRC